MPLHRRKPYVGWLLAVLAALPFASASADEAARTAQGFSQLTAIDAQNVAHLAPVLTFRMGEQGGYTGTVQAAGGLVFVQSPFPHTIYALDPARPDSPVRWKLKPQADTMAWGQACCGTVGGPALDGARLFINTFDGHTIALEAATGRVAWEVRTAQPSQGETLPTA